MKIYALKLTLLNHLFYFTESTNGSRTGDFIGDLALTYAFRPWLAPTDEAIPFRAKPEYEEIADWGFYCTLAIPQKTKPTNVYARNTLFHADGMYDKPSFESAAKSPFKSFFHVQGIQATSEFHCFLIAKEEVKLPPTIRVGNGKETLVKVEEIDRDKQSFWLNAFTHKKVFNNLEQVADLMIDKGIHDRQYVLENYILLKGFDQSYLEEVFEPLFSA
ncbi:type I-D CRISPR-associated protein Cas5/Csc1 [Sediminitomix flava]|uniref:CRISPR type I-D-associated protein Csc1 n=1 Tax=Sediminitomix flava TaxID=379075 RepID=A0A316A2E3_SEDFL|nr:type I-D CRISPR-associated protein Cas5/Csc1 [Sediminitomix flava]PWJ43867.1 CRISPR type I-D-associated protein Csc1 [Sediminitomix flava]